MATNAKQLNEAFLAASDAGGARMAAPSAETTRFSELMAGTYSIGVLPITGDLQDPSCAARLMSQVDKLKVYCSPPSLAASPKEQSYNAVVPPMDPLQ